MKKKLLHIDYDYDFVLIGISCHAKDYRLCWEINKKLGIKLEKNNDKTIDPSKHSSIVKDNEFSGFTSDEENNSYSSYFFMDEGNKIAFTVILNRGTRGLLIPEQKMSDYLLRIQGKIDSKRKMDILKKIQNIPLVLTAFEIDPNKLKSKQKLLLL